MTALRPPKNLSGITKTLLGDPDEYPSYKIGQFTAFFFGRTASWLRWRDKQGDFEDIQYPVSGRRKMGDTREYRLDQIEAVIERLYSQGVISDDLRDIALIGVWQQVVLHNLNQSGDQYVHEGKAYPLSIEDLTPFFPDRPASWIRYHAETVGGVRLAWKEGVSRESWRFPPEALDALVSLSTKSTKKDEDNGEQ